MNCVVIFENGMKMTVAVPAVMDVINAMATRSDNAIEYIIDGDYGHIVFENVDGHIVKIDNFID